MEIVVNNNNTLNIDENSWPDTITKFEINEGVLNINNNSDEIKLLEFDSIKCKVNAMGQSNIIGKLVDLGTGTGELNQTIDLPISGHSLGGLFIETEENSDKYEKWTCINAGSFDLEFTDFANDNKVGRVFKIDTDNNKIVFSDTADNSVVPGKNCKIQVPNIIISTVNGDSNSSHAKIGTGEGGTITFNNVAFSNFYGVYNHHKYFSMKNVTHLFAISCSYIDKMIMKNVVSSNVSKYSSGQNLTYCSELQIEETKGFSYKNYGIVIFYSKKGNIKNIEGIIAKRDSSTDYSIYLKTTVNIDIDNLFGIGAGVKVENVSDCKIDKIGSVDTCLLNHSTANSTHNVIIMDSNNLKIGKVYVPANGAAHTSPLYLLNCSNIDILSGDMQDDNFSYGFYLETNYGIRIIDYYFKGSSNSNSVKVPSKADGITLQNITTDSPQKYRIEAKNSTVKGLYATELDTSTSGSTNSIAYQLYKDDGKGEFVVSMKQNSHSTIVQGTPKFDYIEGLYLRKDDIIEIEIPFTIRGVSFDDVDPIINGSIDKLRTFFKVKTYKEETSYMLLTKDNLKAVNGKIDGVSYILTIRIDASKLDTGEVRNVNNIHIATKDKRFKYPVYFKNVYLNFNHFIAADPDATFVLMYKKDYDNGKGNILSDFNGMLIQGKVNAQTTLHFKYDYMYNNEFGREPNKPFEAILVVTGKNIAEPTYSVVEFNEDSKIVVNAYSKVDNAYQIVTNIHNN